jgi:hypothetical protein
MPLRLIVAAAVVLLFAGCDDTSKDTSQKEGGSVCKGLDEAQCTANNECVWRADKSKCTKKESEQTPQGQSSSQPEGGAPEPAPGTAPANPAQ